MQSTNKSDFILHAFRKKVMKKYRRIRRYYLEETLPGIGSSLSRPPPFMGIPGVTAGAAEAI